MSRVYELPTHLEVQDQLIAGLTAHQLVRLAIGATLAYGLWDQLPWLPDEVRLLLVGMIIGATLVAALFQPAGRPIDQWALAALLFAASPRRLAWQPGSALRQRTASAANWADLEAEPRWLTSRGEGTRA